MDCIIIEDNEVAAFVLKEYIEREDSLKLKEVFKNGEDALAFLKNNHCDLIFLDIEMGGMSGIDLIQRLENTPNIIIISAKPNYAAEAFNFDVVDYIVKPVTYERFERAIFKVNRIKENLQVSDPDFFYLKHKNRMVQIFFKDILYIEALADYVNIYSKHDRYVIYSTMKAIENQFPKKDFIRIHRSFIVRIDKIQEIKENTVLIKEKVLPISRSNKEAVLKKINLY